MITLGPFVLEHPIAAGGMGQVWAGRHLSMGLPVAVKVLVSERARAADARSALLAEARAVARVDHRNVIRLLDVGVIDAPLEAGGARAEPVSATDPTVDLARLGIEATVATLEGEREVEALPPGSPYLVMERADGTLADRLPLPVAEVVPALRAILEGLAAAHARGMIHRDVKPANVLRLGGRWVLADFGVAHAVDAATSLAAAGTPSYMAPEQIAGDLAAQGPWTDLYAVGCLGYALLTGAPPYTGEDRQAVVDGHRFGAPPPLPGAPPEVARWLARLLAKDPRARPRSAPAALALLDGRAPGAFVADWRGPVAPPSFEVIGAGLGLYGLRDVPMVGRDAEREALWRQLEEVHRGGDAGVTLLLGEGGVGKSRLARWLAERAAEAGVARVVRTAGDEPLAQTVARAMDLSPLLVAGAPAESLRAAIVRALDDADPTADEVTEILRLVTGGFRGEGARQARAGVMAQWLGLWALPGPVVWWIDEAQVAPEALEALEACLMFDDGAGLPLQAVLTVAEEGEGARPATHAATSTTRPRLAGLLGRAPVRSLVLEPLPPLELRALVRDLLHLDGAPAAEVERRAGGHAGFAVEWVGHRVERGELVPGPDGFRLAPGAALTLPLDRLGVWGRRAASLVAEGGWRPLAVAAALAPTVDEAVLAAACGPEVAAAQLGRLSARGWARCTASGWRFTRYALVEAVAGQARAAGVWVAANRDAAAALGRIPGADPALRARLHLEGAEPDRAIAPLLAAARRAVEEGAYAAALGLLDQRAGLVGGEDPDPDAAGIVRLRALRKISRPEPAIALGQRLWARLPPDAHADRVRVAVEWTAALRKRARLDEATSIMGEALSLARASGDTELRALAATTLGRQLALAGRLDEADALLEEARTHAKAPHTQGSAAWAAGLVACRRERWGEARRSLEEARDTWRAIGNLHGVSDVENQLGEVYRGCAELEEADARYLAAIRFARLGGVEDTVPQLNRGLLALDRGRWAEARRTLRGITGLLQLRGNVLALAFSVAGRLRAAAALGDAEEWVAAQAVPVDFAEVPWPELGDLLDEALAAAEEAGLEVEAVRRSRAALPS